MCALYKYSDCIVLDSSVLFKRLTKQFRDFKMALRHEAEHRSLLKKGQTGRADRLRKWLDDDEKKSNKRADDRVKVLIGAAVLYELQRGHTVDLRDKDALLLLMSEFLVRDQERLAVLGANGTGSAAFHRCTSSSL